VAQIIILTGTVQEAARYTRETDLPRGRFIAPMSASQIDGVVPSEVHVLPGFLRRRDRHAILAAVKRSSKRYQGVKWIEVGVPTVQAEPEPVVEPEDTSNGGNMEAEGAPVAPEPKRRRSRCAKCETLHFPNEPCDRDGMRKTGAAYEVFE
jgi:hypothetical protein